MPIRPGTVAEIREQMLRLLEGIVPEAEIVLKAELVHEILRLKEERGAIILGHNYMEPALFHTVPDVTGDSLELARRAAATDRDPIVFCGVKFMAETAKILNPDRTVLLPSEKAGCSLAESITAEDVRLLREMFPGVPVVTYINTYADVKAECDVCCTSSNAAKVVESLGSDTVIFLPDEYLAANVARETGRRILYPVGADRKPTLQVDSLEHVILGWKGRCEVHEQFTVEDVRRVREQFPDAIVLAHPECPPDVVEAADFAGSTTAMARYVKESPAKRYMLFTECSMADNIAAENRDKEMIRMCSVRCPHMNEITLEDTLRALRENVVEITVPKDVAARARNAIERMLAVRA